MKRIRQSRGAIHIVAIVVCLLCLFGIFLISQWMKQVDRLSDRVSVLQHNLEALETKVKYLDLKIDADNLVKPSK